MNTVWPRSCVWLINCEFWHHLDLSPGHSETLSYSHGKTAATTPSGNYTFRQKQIALLLHVHDIIGIINPRHARTIGVITAIFCFFLSVCLYVCHTSSYITCLYTSQVRCHRVVYDIFKILVMWRFWQSLHSWLLDDDVELLKDKRDRLVCWDSDNTTDLSLVLLK